MAKKRARKQPAGFTADRPIDSLADDRLGRAAFAEGLAKRIRSWRGKESVVISLCGEWGCGKTSLKNMVLEHLRRAKTAKVDVLEFSPWEISGHGSVAAAFFRELAVKIAPVDSAAKGQKHQAAERLDRYGKYFAFGGKALSFIGNGMDATLIPGGAYVRQIGNAATNVSEAAASGAQAQAATFNREPSLTELKRELCADMAKLSKPILVVIDDIDRLTHEEIREVFQLVKANANFPNLTYLLMFDRGIVASALDSISGGRGLEFLDKIVQVPLDVPQPSIEDVHKVLFDGINLHLVKPSVDERWEHERWQQIWWSGLSDYFPNLRCVYRFLGSFGFHASHMEIDGAFELNPVDLLVLETLRLFEPSLYGALSLRRTLLTDPKKLRVYINNKDLDTLVETNISELLSLAKLKSRQDGVREILTGLFPALLMHDEQDYSELLRYLRVGHREIFPRYFTLSLAAGDVMQADVDALRQNFTYPAQFYQLCQSLDTQGKLAIAFTRLETYKTVLPENAFPRACN